MGTTSAVPNLERAAAGHILSVHFIEDGHLRVVLTSRASFLLARRARSDGRPRNVETDICQFCPSIGACRACFPSPYRFYHNGRNHRHG